MWFGRFTLYQKPFFFCIFLSHIYYLTTKAGNHRNMTFEQEEEFLKQFEERAKKVELLSTNEIKEAYIESVGHSIGHEQIYRVLKRHGYRKIMPRSRHPKKASDEEIEQSKKIADLVQKTKIENPDKTVRLLFEDEASFGRINKPKCCWSSDLAFPASTGMLLVQWNL